RRIGTRREVASWGDRTWGNPKYLCFNGLHKPWRQFSHLDLGDSGHRKMAEGQNFWGGWRERLSALRNVPPVLKIVWQSGPTVVTLGLVLRLIASLTPIAAISMTKRIL